jgi:hypothetical protein
MITKETAGRIWNCYREIEAADKLVADMREEAERWDKEPEAATLRDAFGKRRHLELGVPSGKDCHRLLRVCPSLAAQVIAAHRANMAAELSEANEQAQRELATMPDLDHERHETHERKP